MAKNGQKWPKVAQNRAYVIYGWPLREQRAELESKKDLYVAQSRCLKDEVSTIKSEIRERKDRIEKLKIRHEHTVMAMGETKKVRKNMYSHLFNKRGGGAKVAKSLNVEVGINVEGGIFWKKLVHNSNKRGVEGGKI